MTLRLLLLLALALAGAPVAVSAQLQLGTIEGVVTGPDDSPVAGALVTLLDRRGSSIRSTTSTADGRFRIDDVQPGAYALRAAASSLRGELRALDVGAALPMSVTLRMSAVAAEQLLVRAPAVEAGATSSRVTLGQESLRDTAVRVRSRGLQDVLATVPGWSSEDNGLVHVRGVDEGVLYVIDGVPAYERFDGLFGVAPDPMTLETITVSTGYIPPEFGFKSGAVVELRSAAMQNREWTGALDVGFGTDRTAGGGAFGGGPLSRTTALAFNLSGQRSERFLDPTHPDNLHNTGRALSGGLEFGWHIGTGGSLRAVAGASSSRFDVPHEESQDEAGQDQRQRVDASWLSVAWQQAWSSSTLSQLSGYYRTSGGTLSGTADDTPLLVNADRRSGRRGVLLSASHSRGRHLFKFGGEAARVTLRENFGFAVVDPEGGDFSDAAIAFTPDAPFLFDDRAAGSLLAAYIQESFRAMDQLTLDVGVRVDASRLLVAASQWSLRAGAAYAIDRTSTTLRGSFGRFYQPPQSENLLLSSSPEARVLSPFASTEAGGGATLYPERQSAVEVAVNQEVGRWARFDVAYWRRWVEDAADPNVFYGTTILFPNTVARGWASGVDVRIDLPRRGGWSAFVSYANARVEQAGPITGGLFLEDEVEDIASGERFTPDHDQRNTGAAGVSFVHGGLQAALTARYESGTPIQVEDDDLDELMERPGAELVDFERGRVKPRHTLDVVVSQRIARTPRSDLTLRAAITNVTGSRWAYNFGNPFSGTHFGPGRGIQVELRAAFR